MQVKARIVVDAFGGDNAPGEIIRGAVDALKMYPDIQLILTGEQEAIRKELSAYEYDKARLLVVDAPQVITLHEEPVRAIRSKKDSSIVRGFNLIKEGQADAFVSAGSTGAVLAGAQLILRTLPGIHRPALAPMIPTNDHPALLIDCGANVDCKPINLQQFAIMGAAYMHAVANVSNPRVGLINIGVEEGKGNALVKETYGRLQEMPINFVGNVEARDITAGAADVLVCDAFVGNVVLKFMEGLAKTLMSMLKTELTSKTTYKLGAALAKPAFRNFKNRMDYEKYGGAPLLGVNGCVFKSHGSSKAGAICATIGQARGFVAGGTLKAITDGIVSANAKYDRLAESKAE